MHDAAVKSKLRQAKIDLKQAMLEEDENELDKQIALVEGLTRGLLPSRPKGRAPIYAPGNGGTKEPGTTRFWAN